MKRLLMAAALALALATSCSAQQPPQPQDHTMEALLGAREKLIHRYVQSEKVAARVSVCGTTDMLTGEDHSYLCIYVYRDSVKEFLKDFGSFAVPDPAGNLAVDGVPVALDLIGPVKPTDKIPNAQPQPIGTAPTSKI